MTANVRYHSSDDMDGLGEFSSVIEPVAVVLRRDGSVDVYGYVAVVDQREPEGSTEGPCEDCKVPAGQPCEIWCIADQGTAR